MVRLAFVVALLPGLAHAKPGELKPPPGAFKDLDGVSKIEKPGAGQPPDDCDDVTYRYDVFPERDRQRVIREDKTRRMTDANDRIRDTLLQMKPGEVRWSWFAEQDGSLCDHFGCSRGPTPYAARLELVSVTRHHDELPDGIHVTAWPFLGVRQGTRWAALPGDKVSRIESVRLAGDHVTIDLVQTRFPRNDSRRDQIVVAVSELRARLETARGLDAMKRKQWKAAKAAFERAIALAPALDAPHLHRAAAQLALRETPSELGVVVARNPAGVYWRVMSDDALAGLRSARAIRGLVVGTPGTFDPVPLYRCHRDCLGIAVDPSKRFVVAFAGTVLSAEHGLATGVLRIIDRQSGAVVDTIPLDNGGPGDANDGTARCARCTRLVAAQQMLRDLGFSPPSRAAVTIEYFDREHAWPRRPHVVFKDAKLELVLAADRPTTSNQVVAIAPPVDTKVTEAELLDDLVIVRWAMMGGAPAVTDVVAFRRP